MYVIHIVSKRKATVTSESKSPKYPPNTRLRDAREACGWSQKELAEKIGTIDVNVSRWENGTTFPSAYYRKLLCDIFGKTLTELGLVPPATMRAKIEAI